MERTRKTVAAVAVLVAAPLALGCWDNRLPPRDLPTEQEQRALPRWYPEQAWSEKGGQSQIYIRGKIVFDTNKAIIRPGSEKVLDTLLKFLKEHPEVTRLRIEGHTDARASEDYNQELSAKRALAVANWLVDQGIENLRLLAVGFGESRPLGPNELVEGRNDNRRVEFHVAEVSGKPFGGKDPYAGGYALEVLSLEERKLRAEEEAKRRRPPPRPPPFKATGDEVKPVEVKPPIPIANEPEPGPAEAPKPPPPKPAGDAPKKPGG